MVANAVFNVVGVIMGAVGMVSMGQDLFADKQGATTNVRLHIGHAKKSDNTGGSLPDIALFDVYGEEVGRKESSDNGHVKNGNYVDIKVKHTDPDDNRQSEYISISAGMTDAICIAGITVTWPDDGKQAWVGDTGYLCDAPWFYSETVVGEPNYKPKCIWIDSDGSNGLPYAGMGMHITDFASESGRDEQYQENRDTMCKSPPRFQMYEELGVWNNIPYFDPPLKYVEGTLVDKDIKKVLVDGKVKNPKPGAPRPEKKRECYPGYMGQMICTRDESSARLRSTERKKAKPTGKRFMAGRLVISEHRGQSAKEVCESRSSAGPDFYSAEEKLFCDMETKKLYPACGQSTDNTICFDVTTKKLRSVAGAGRLRRDLAAVPDKKYDTVSHWK